MNQQQEPRPTQNEVLTLEEHANTEETAEPPAENVEVKQLSELILQSINGGAFNSEQFADKIAASHRWIQQAFYDGVIKPTIKKLAENGSDPRNERAVNECEQIVEEVFENNQ